MKGTTILYYFCKSKITSKLKVEITTKKQVSRHLTWGLRSGLDQQRRARLPTCLSSGLAPSGKGAGTDLVSSVTKASGGVQTPQPHTCGDSGEQESPAGRKWRKARRPGCCSHLDEVSEGCPWKQFHYFKVSSHLCETFTVLSQSLVICIACQTL